MSECEGDVCVIDKKAVTFGEDSVLEFDKNEPVIEMRKKETDVSEETGGISWIVVLIFVIMLIVVIVLVSKSKTAAVVAAQEQT